MAKEDVTLEGTLERETRKAWLIKITKPKRASFWVPKTQIKDSDCFAEGDTGTFTVTRWIAEKNDLVEDDE